MISHLSSNTSTSCFIHWLHKYILGTYYVLVPRDTKASKQLPSPTLMGLKASGRETYFNQIITLNGPQRGEPPGNGEGRGEVGSSEEASLEYILGIALCYSSRRHLRKGGELAALPERCAALHSSWCLHTLSSFDPLISPQKRRKQRTSRPREGSELPQVTRPGKKGTAEIRLWSDS